MNRKLDEFAQVQVEITRLKASGEEVERLKELIKERFYNNVESIVSKYIGNGFYGIYFRFIDAKKFNMTHVEKLLHGACFDNWKVSGVFVPLEK
ncbi:MAG: hypothetical protein MI794_05875 [Pseudomonadales bacterium]|nr:hypothetical protein [Pseudomonadales bacterium]